MLLFGITIANLFLPKRDFSESENRYLQQFPAFSAEDFLSAKYMNDIDTFASDQFMGRDRWISLKTLTELAMLKKDNGRVYFGRDNTLFDATETINEAGLETNLNAVVSFAEKLKQSVPDLRASALLIPTASAVEPDKLPKNAPVPDQQAALKKAASLLGDTVPLFDSLDLLQHTAGLMFYRTDHHWTTDAAFAVYTAWAPAMGLTPLARDDFTEATISESFDGTLYSKANLLTIPPDSVKAYYLKEAGELTADYGQGDVRNTLFFDEFLDQKDKYSYFLGGNKAEVKIHTGTANGRTLLLVQDSYAHCFVPFLTAHYENILAVDPRYLNNINYLDYARENKVTDLLVLYNLPNFSEDKNVVRIIK